MRPTPRAEGVRDAPAALARGLAASLVADVTKISQSHDVAPRGGGGARGAALVPVLLFDLIFLARALARARLARRTTLRACAQTHKLDMYTRLAYVIGTFVALVIAADGPRAPSRGSARSAVGSTAGCRRVLLEVLNFAAHRGAALSVRRPLSGAQLRGHRDRAA